MAVNVNDVYHDGHTFYQVISATDKSVVVRPIETEVVGLGDVRTAFDYDIVVRPRIGRFTTSWLFNERQNAKGRRCRVRQFNTDPDGPTSICLSQAFGVWAYQLVGTDETLVENDYR